MEGLSWSASPHHEAFRRQPTAADTLNRLASFIARAEAKSCKQLPQPQPPPPRLQTDAALPKPHRCSSCGLAFSLRSSLQLHDCATFPKRPPPAPPLSSQRPTGRAAFSPYACASCGRAFVLKQALLHHQQSGCCTNAAAIAAASPSRRSEPASPASSAEDSSSSTSLCVPEEARALPEEEASRRHSRDGHSDEQDTDSCESWSLEGRPRASGRSRRGVFSCRSCDMVFCSTAKLSRHRKELHSRGSKVSEELLPVILKVRRATTYTCQVCSQVFFHHLSLWAHKKKHPANGSLAQGDARNNHALAQGDARNNHALAQGDARNNHALAQGDASKLRALTQGNANNDRAQTPRNTSTNHTLIQRDTSKGHTPTPKTDIKLASCKVLLRECDLTKALKKLPPKLPKAHRFTAPFEPLNGDSEDEREAEDDEGDEEEEEEEEDFPCPSCPEVFSQHAELTAHAELHQSAVKRSRCSVCRGEMDSLLKWPGSKRPRLYHCLLCQTGFCSLQPFLTHCQGHLKNKVEET